VSAREFYFLPEDLKAPTTPSIPWFHNPIHDMESAWWIVVWTFCQLKHWVKDSLFTDHTLRAPTVFAPMTFRNKCTGLPAAILEPLIQWLTFMRDKYKELGKQISDGTHLSFDYDEVFIRVIGYIEEITEALSKMQDPTLDTEERASKRRRVGPSKGNE
jgi:hypothetical protein